MSHPITLTNANFEDEVLRSETPVIVDYWAPWCGPCRMVGPAIDQIAAERAGTVKVGKVNVDEEPELAARAGVQSIPFIVLYKDGQPVAQVLGARPKAAIEQVLALDDAGRAAA
jgi:thioredoxin 1